MVSRDSTARRVVRVGIAVLGVFVGGCGGQAPVNPAQPVAPEDRGATPRAALPLLNPSDLAFERREAALGPWVGLDERMRRVFDPGAFEPLGPPLPGSWRARVHESSQGYDDFVVARRNPVEPGRQTLVLLPLGSFPTEMVIDGEHVFGVRTPELYEMRGFLRTYFGLPVDVVTPMPIDDLDLPTRARSGRTQYDAAALVDAFVPVLPEHAYSMTVLINRDLFAAPERAFGFGYATHYERLAVMSFARLDPLVDGTLHGIEAEERIRERAYKLLAHEVAHTFGLRHCDHYACIMNGMADPLELDRTPLHLCPVCLRKLLHVLDIDPEARYRALADWYTEFSVEAEASWVQQRLARIEAP
ncbi:MAG: archaemetzincin [Myxococcota bacterium]